MTERRRLLVVTSTFPRHAEDPTPGFVRDLARYEAGFFDTLVVAPRLRGAARHESTGGLTVSRFAYFPRRWEDLADGAILENLRARASRWLQVVPFLLAEAVAVRRAVRSFRPDVVHLHWVVPQGLVALVAARRLPWVVTTLGADVYALRGPLWRAVQRSVLRRSAAVTTQNRELRDLVIGLGADPSRVVVLAVGADATAFETTSEGFPPAPGARILFVGRLVEKKGLAVLLEALGRLTDQQWALDVVGDGPMRASLEASARGLAGRVRFWGAQPRSRVAAAMAACDVLVVPSVPASSGDQDGLPVVVLEGMAAGCAIVASRLPGIDEVVDDGASGVLVDAGDPDGLAKAISSVLEDDGLRSQLGRGAREAARRHSVDSVGPRFVSLLEDAATRPPAERRRTAG